jgi:ATP-dependent Zn protease
MQIDAQYDATQALTEAESLLTEVTYGAQEGSVTYKSALDELNEAKLSQVDATDRVTEAIDRETEAVRKLREAEEELQTVRGQTPAAIQAKVDETGAVITDGGASKIVCLMV